MAVLEIMVAAHPEMTKSSMYYSVMYYALNPLFLLGGFANTAVYVFLNRQATRISRNHFSLTFGDTQEVSVPDVGLEARISAAREACEIQASRKLAKHTSLLSILEPREENEEQLSSAV
jgi:hypothetical protein